MAFVWTGTSSNVLMIFGNNIPYAKLKQANN